MCHSGNCIAVSRAKIVSTSAARVATRRHSALASRRIAESITPAWLMPTQNTKFVIMNPHMTGRFNPNNTNALVYKDHAGDGRYPKDGGQKSRG